MTHSMPWQHPSHDYSRTGGNEPAIGDVVTQPEVTGQITYIEDGYIEVAWDNGLSGVFRRDKHTAGRGGLSERT